MTFKFLYGSRDAPQWMAVQMTPLGLRNHYNLSVGEWPETLPNFVDDQSIGTSRNELLTVIAAIVWNWLEHFPRRTLIFQGNSPVHNRLYRMGIAACEDFWEPCIEIFGVAKGSVDAAAWEPFDQMQTYHAFAIRRKVLSTHPPPANGLPRLQRKQSPKEALVVVYWPWNSLLLLTTPTS